MFMIAKRKPVMSGKLFSFFIHFVYNSMSVIMSHAKFFMASPFASHSSTVRNSMDL